MGCGFCCCFGLDFVEDVVIEELGGFVGRVLEMSSVKDLVEEAKKRIVLLLVCVFGLSYLMSCKWWFFFGGNFSFWVSIGNFIAFCMCLIWVFFFAAFECQYQ